MTIIVDYGVGNLFSMTNALRAIGADVSVSSEPGAIAGADRLILPGVGAFARGMQGLRDRELVAPLEAARGRGASILGVCLGMQLFFETSEEGGRSEGLGWIPGQVRRLSPSPGTLKVPHMGWNSVTHDGDPLFQGMGELPNFYFVHSYVAVSAFTSGTFTYGGNFAASVRKGRLAGVQFHPEKSQSFGLQLLRNFACPPC